VVGGGGGQRARLLLHVAQCGMRFALGGGG
jgi:hypothetical protein